MATPGFLRKFFPGIADQALNGTKVTSSLVPDVIGNSEAYPKKSNMSML